MALREWLGDLGSLDGGRAGNFERCVRTAGGVSLDDDLARMLNTQHVRIAALSNERERRYSR